MKQQDFIDMYAGALEPWQVRLALSRIQALRFARQDWPDLMQELAMVIVQFEYDPARGHGASAETALYGAINRHLLYLLRGRCRDCKRFVQYLRMLGLSLENIGDEWEPSFEPDTPLALDLEQAVAGLPNFDQDVAARLAEGMSCAQIARALECEWKTVKKAMGRIKAHFQELGISPEGLR